VGQQFDFAFPGDYQIDYHLRFSSVGPQGTATAAFNPSIGSVVPGSYYGSATNLFREGTFITNIPINAQTIYLFTYTEDASPVTIAAGDISSVPSAGGPVQEVTAGITIQKLSSA